MYYSSSNNAQVAEFKQNHPFIVMMGQYLVHNFPDRSHLNTFKFFPFSYKSQPLIYIDRINDVFAEMINILRIDEHVMILVCKIICIYFVLFDLCTTFYVSVGLSGIFSLNFKWKLVSLMQAKKNFSKKHPSWKLFSLHLKMVNFCLFVCVEIVNIRTP